MSRNRFRIGSIAVLFAVVVLCVAIFGVLTVSSAVSDRRAAERYGEHVEVLYACGKHGRDRNHAQNGDHARQHAA